jgi:hypothetical protein
VAAGSETAGCLALMLLSAAVRPAIEDSESAYGKLMILAGVLSHGTSRDPGINVAIWI